MCSTVTACAQAHETGAANGRALGRRPGTYSQASKAHRVPEDDWSQRKRVSSESSRCIVQLAQAHTRLASNQPLYVTRRLFAWDPRADDNVVARGCPHRVAAQQQASYHCSLSHSVRSHPAEMPTLPSIQPASMTITVARTYSSDLVWAEFVKGFLRVECSVSSTMVDYPVRSWATGDAAFTMQ